MNEAAKAARREYIREWNRKNPDKLREYRERYWTKKAQEAENAGEHEDAEPQEG